MQTNHLSEGDETKAEKNDDIIQFVEEKLNDESLQSKQLSSIEKIHSHVSSIESKKEVVISKHNDKVRTSLRQSQNLIKIKDDNLG